MVEEGETRGERREGRHRKRQRKMLQHGKAFIRVYRNAISKRLRRKEDWPLGED